MQVTAFSLLKLLFLLMSLRFSYCVVVYYFLIFKRTDGRESGFTKGNYITIQLISVGDVKVGKSCIIKRYCEGRFVQKYITTIGVDYGVKKVNVSGRKVAVNFFDLSGSPDYE